MIERLSSRSRRAWVGVLAVCAVLRCGAATAADPLALETLHDAVPALRLHALGTAPSLDTAALAGRVVLLHFWATWCTPCRAELPALQDLAAHLDPARVTIVLVAIDEDASAEEISAYAHKLGVEVPLYLARDSTVSARFWSWGVPVSYLIDARGHFIGRARGPRDWRDAAVRDYVAGLGGS